MLYKKRKRLRLKKAYQHSGRATGHPGTRNRGANRVYDLGGLSKQVGRSYPRHFPFKWMTRAEWELIGWNAPRYQSWGVVRSFGPDFDDVPAWARLNGAHTGYHDRRVKAIPKIGQLSLLPYRLTLAELVPQNVYPFEFYPSGRRSYASLQGWI